MSFFHTPKPRQFHIKPRYYDPREEEVKERQKRLGLDESTDNETRLRMEMQRKWRDDARRQRSQNSFKKTIIYLVIAGFLIWLIFFH